MYVYVLEFLNLSEILTVLYDLPGFATIQQVECIDLVHIQTVEPMVIDTMMIDMETERKIEMVMEEKENWAIEMMIGIIAMEIVMVEIMRNVMAEMVTEMMTTGEEVEVLITNMTREAGARIETVMMMMANTRLGMSLYDIITLINYSFIHKI